MTDAALIALAGLAAAFLIDSTALPRRARPSRPWRSLPGSWLLLLMNCILFGGFLALCGSPVVAVLLALALQVLLAQASNAKRAMLGESLVFSDLALIGAVFRHPQFYLSALKGWQLACAIVAALGLLAALAWLFVPAPAPHIAGATIFAIGLVLLVLSLRLAPFRALAREPRAEADLVRLGLLPTLLLYWLRWRESVDPPSCPASATPAPLKDSQAAAPLIVAIQCESFADPAELFGDRQFALSGLARAQANAVRWGNLLVSGFGAYTMRTEYGVLFGRSEDELGFRRFDPFLTARGEASYGLPNRLGTESWRSVFVHPHDMRFYGRDRSLPAAGFAELVGPESFDPPTRDEGIYVTDAAIARKVMMLAEQARSPTLLYAVTIENHGPWSSSGGRSVGDLVRNYNQLVGAGDVMLSGLADGLAALKRPALLVFFGDHRPSIPGASEPGSARHTPYVMLRFDERGRIVPGENARRDLTPAELHHAILEYAP
ncbi:LTA synthase family protein [Pelagerythrobacter sp.]|uniref:LTA synthase family protein n=1 Tax=Pelagerythrobacter sp. TaxID=2800702 RepID=UPI0035B1D579